MAELIQKQDTLNEGREKINAAITDAEHAKITADGAETKATQALANSESTQTQLDTIVINGDSSVEAAQARVDEKGVGHTTLKERIDDGFLGVRSQLNDTNSQLAQTVNLLRNISVDVTDPQFGAHSITDVGFETFDSTQAFTDAIAYLESIGGGKLKVPNGIFLANFELPSNITIEGNGVKNTIIKSVPKSDKDVIKGENFDTLTLLTTRVETEGVRFSYIKDLTIDGNKSNNTTGYGIKIWGCFFGFSNIFVTNCAEDGILTEFTTHVAPNGTNDLYALLESRFSDVKITNCRNGWIYNGPHDSIIDNLVIVECDEWAFKQRNKWSYLVANNWNFWLNGNGIQVGTGMSGNYIVSNNNRVGIGIEFLSNSFQSMLMNVRMSGYSQGIVLRGGYNNIKGILSGCTDALTIESGSGQNVELIATGSENLINIAKPEGGTNRFIIQSIGSTNILKTGSGNFRSDAHVEINTGNRSDKNVFQIPFKNLVSGGWTMGFPLSNGDFLTTTKPPTTSDRGGIKTQPTLPDVTAPPTAAEFNTLLSRLKNAGILASS